MDESISINEVKSDGVQRSYSISSARKFFGLNILSNIVYHGLAIILTIWMTPFLINHLGMAAYGMIPLVGTITSYMGVFTSSMNIAVSRFLGINLGAGNYETANKTFNTSLFGILGVIGVLTPIVAVIAIFFPALFNVPSGWETDASGLFVLVAISFFVSVISGIFALSPFISSQFVPTNIVNIISLCSRLVFLFAIYTAFEARLWYVGASILTHTTVSLIGFIILWRRFTPQLHVQISQFDRSQLRSLSGMGGWTLVNSLGGMLLNRVDLIVINAYFAAVITGGYGTMTQFPVLMETLVATASTVIRPIMLLKYAQGDLLSLRDFSFRSVKLFGTALALPVGLICGFSQPLISIWLGPDYAYFNTLLIILVCHMSLSLAVKPLMYIQNTYNMVRWPGIVTLLCGVASVIADLLIVKLGWGYLAIAGSTAIIWSLRNVIFTPIYSAHNMKLPWWSFLPSLIFTLIGTLFVWGTSYILTIFYMPNSFFTLAGAATIISLLYAVFAWVFGINAAEKEMLIDLARVNINLILRRSKI